MVIICIHGKSLEALNELLKEFSCLGGFVICERLIIIAVIMNQRICSSPRIRLIVIRKVRNKYSNIC